MAGTRVNTRNLAYRDIDALIDSERRFRLLVEGVIDYAIYMLDPNGIVTNWNAGAERIKGYARRRNRRPAFQRLLYPGGTRRRPARARARDGAARRADTRPKAGASARTARASARRW